MNRLLPCDFYPAGFRQVMYHLFRWVWSILRQMNLTRWPLWDLDVILKILFSILFYWLVSWDLCTYDNALRWMPQNITDGKSTLVQLMAWCRQATSHYLSLCWPRSMSPYGVIRPQWVNGVMWLYNSFALCNICTKDIDWFCYNVVNFLKKNSQ